MLLMTGYKANNGCQTARPSLSAFNVPGAILGPFWQVGGHHGLSIDENIESLGLNSPERGDAGLFLKQSSLPPKSASFLLSYTLALTQQR